MMKKRLLISILVVAVLLIAVAMLNGSGGEVDAVSQSAELEEKPNSFTQSNGGGDPRSPGYWTLWNTCAPENRAEVAEANGGREAGWVLMDDLLVDPGIQVGELPIVTCEQGLALLGGGADAEESLDAAVYDLAAQILAAEINLNLGAESCPDLRGDELGHFSAS